MKTRVRKTSIEAYHSLNLGARQREVYRALRRHPMTNRQLSDELGLDINCITPRTNELLKQELVEEKTKIKCPRTNRKAIVWGIVEDPRQGRLFA